MQTSVTVDNLDFEEFIVDDNMHVGIMLRDFKSIAIHAESLKTSVTARYSLPTRPMQLTYFKNGVCCEFTLMTIGDYRSQTSAPTRIESRQITSHPIQKRKRRESSPEASPEAATGQSKIADRTMPPPAIPIPNQATIQPNPSAIPKRPSPPPPKASIDPESLFLQPCDDDDQEWGENNWHEDDDEDTIGWSANIRVHASFGCELCNFR